MTTLTIISHTEHYKDENGTIVGFGPTVTEINHLLHVFDEIQHVAMLHNKPAPASALPYSSNKITFIALPALGGKKITNKLKIIIQTPKVLSIVAKSVSKTDYFQFRAPTGIGVFIIPYLILFSSKNGWFKYAGNWKQEHAPLAYRFQRWLLKNQKRKVTINGTWPAQPKHCITFENPCITHEELQKGINVIENKNYNNTHVTFCFVGRLEKEKGIDILIKSFARLSAIEKSKIDAIHVVGSGENMNVYKQMTANSNLNFVFHGFLSRSKVHDIYKVSHAIILPSASEGFPKVISEAMNYGCTFRGITIR